MKIRLHGKTVEKTYKTIKDAVLNIAKEEDCPPLELLGALSITLGDLISFIDKEKATEVSLEGLEHVCASLVEMAMEGKVESPTNMYLH